MEGYALRKRSLQLRISVGAVRDGVIAVGSAPERWCRAQRSSAGSSLAFSDPALDLWEQLSCGLVGVRPASVVCMSICETEGLLTL